MMKSIRFGLVILLSIVVLIYFGREFYRYYLSRQISKPVTTTKSEYLSSIDRYVYFKDYRRGFSLVVKSISLNPEYESGPDYTRDLIFKTDLDIFYRIDNDTVFIFTREVADTPNKLKIPVKQIKMSNPEYMNLYDSYKDQNMKMF